MNKSKTLEVLRGMKFMQRKEETRRRELFEVDHQKQLNERIRSATQGTGENFALQSSSSRPIAATIVYDTSFPRESYGLSRRSFLRKVSSSAVSKTTATTDPQSMSAEAHEKGQKGEEYESSSESNNNEDAVEDPTAVGRETKNNRFYLASRAPVLPKGLGKQLKNEKRAKRQRDDQNLHLQIGHISPSMSEEQQQQQQRLVNVSATATTEDNFTAMRQAALSMFKQRTKDLTMVSSLTAEAAEVEQLNAQVQATIHQLQEQKASLDAQIETEERCSREREAQLRAVHAMLARLKEDQGAFSGVQRASESVVATIQSFISQFTAKDGAAARLMDRGQERTQGRGPNDWRAAANDLRRRQATVAEHIRHMESEAAVPSGLTDIARDWALGAWRQQAECEGALRECEMMTRDDAVREALARLPPEPSCDTPNVVYDEDEDEDDNNSNNNDNNDISPDSHEGGEKKEAEKGDAAIIDAHMAELDALRSAACIAERGLEAVGLCGVVHSAQRSASCAAAWANALSAKAAACAAAKAKAEAQNALRECTAQRDEAAAAAERVEASLMEEEEEESNTENNKENNTEEDTEGIDATRERWALALRAAAESAAESAEINAAAEKALAAAQDAALEAERAIAAAALSAESVQKAVAGLCEAAASVEKDLTEAEETAIALEAERAAAECAESAQRDACGEAEALLLREVSGPATCGGEESVEALTREGEEEKEEESQKEEEQRGIELARELVRQARSGELARASFAQGVEAGMLLRVASAVVAEEERIEKEMAANRALMESIEEEIAALAEE